MPPIITPTPFKEAVAKLSNKVPVKADLSSKEWSKLPAELREAAFFSAHVESAKFLGSAQKFLGDYLKTSREKAPDGSTMLKAQGREQFVRDMREKMQAWGMPVSGTEVNDITDKSSVGRLRLIFETQVAQANEYGRFKVANENEAIRRAFPAQRFVRLAGKKDARPVHSAHTGEVRLKTDLAFWLAMNAREIGGFGVPRGPWGFNSGMGTEDVGRSEAIALGLVKKGDPTPPPIPDDGFLAGMQASTANIPPEVMAQLEKAMGPKMKKKGADAIAPVFKAKATPRSKGKAVADSPPPSARPSAPMPLSDVIADTPEPEFRDTVPGLHGFRVTRSGGIRALIGVKEVGIASNPLLLAQGIGAMLKGSGRKMTYRRPSPSTGAMEEIPVIATDDPRIIAAGIRLAGMKPTLPGEFIRAIPRALALKVAQAFRLAVLRGEIKDTVPVKP